MSKSNFYSETEGVHNETRVSPTSKFMFLYVYVFGFLLCIAYPSAQEVFGLI